MLQKKYWCVLILLVMLITSQPLTGVSLAEQTARHTPITSADPSPVRNVQAGDLIGTELPVPQREQEIRDSQTCKPLPTTTRSRLTPQDMGNCPTCPSSDIAPDKCDDSTFIADCTGGVDTGCTFRGGGPLAIPLKVTRVVGDVNKLKANGLISPTANLKMPAFDVDFFGGGGQFNPERDRISFNGHVVPGEFLQGDNGVWRLNEFEIPIEWVNFPPDPGPGGTVTPTNNTVQIDIDTANSQEVWCTSLDWVELQIQVVRPVVMAHGILSNGGTWDRTADGFSWVNKLNSLGIPNSNRLNMGRLDSIGNNAAKIANEVAASKRRWGVDKVNIVAHSKGGLDSREYVEGNDSVERLVQLGTPNAGSPLADKIQGILIRGGARFGLIGALAPVLIEAFAAPAAIQLTTPYMRLYNARHGSNPKVGYTALAGDYNPDCFFLNPFCKPLERILLRITGRGDTIVPVSSVHALGYTQNRTFSSRGDKAATHTQLTGSSGVYDSVSDRVRAFGTNSLTQDAEPIPTIAETASEVDSIRQRQVKTQTLAIDQATPTTFALMYPAGNLDMALISPSGQRFDAGTVVGNPDVSRDEGQYLGGIMEVYAFNAPEVGVWTVEVSAPSVVDPSGEVGYAVSAFIDQPAITFTGSLANASVHMGETLRLIGAIRNNGAAVTGAVVNGLVGLPDNTVSTVTLHDDGANGDAVANDGTYAGDFAGTSQPGNYRIAFLANGSASQNSPAFSRSAFALATVSRSTSSITGPFHDTGLDTDGDGLFNNLAIEVGVNITDAARYSLSGTLTDSHGNALTARSVATLNPGSNVVTLKFDGETIFNGRVDGPYTLTSLRLDEEGDLEILPVDERDTATQTAAYSYLSFQHPPIFLTGNGSAEGIDINGNGLFDFLSVGVEVNVPAFGFYQWSARLTDRNGKDLGFASNFDFLSPGPNTISLIYDGERIGRNGVDGPYFVRGLLVFGAGNSLISSNAFSTGPFSASQFEGFGIDTTPPTLQVSVSPSVLWSANHGLVSITASVSVQDNLDLNPTVELVSITSNEPINGRGDGNTDGDIQGAAFGTDDRQFLLRAERSGNLNDRVYTILYRAHDAAGNTATATATVTVPHNMR